MKIEELKGSIILAFVVMGIGLFVTIFVGLAQYIVIIIPFFGSELVLTSWGEYVAFFGGSIFGIVFLFILEATKILKIHVQPFKEEATKE